MRKRRTYLDYAAGLPIGRCGNPSSPHTEGRKAREQLEGARKEIAHLIEVQSDDIIFTSGATEANALGILGYVRALRRAGRKNLHILYLPSAHASIIENVKLLAEEGAEIESLPIKAHRVDSEALAKMIRNETVLIVMDAVCGETGVVWNTREVAEILARADNPKKESAQAARPIQLSFSGLPTRALLYIDASQASLTEKITRAHFGADMLTFDASKISVTRGIGALVAHRTIPLEPLYRGGDQERGLRPGTEAPELAEKFASHLKRTALNRGKFRTSAEQERVKLIKAITDTISSVFINENPRADWQAPHILNLSFPGFDTDYLVALLDEAGFAVSTRSACETNSENGSRAVFALTGDMERARTTLRISWGPDIHSRKLARFAQALAQSVAFIDNTNQR